MSLSVVYVKGERRIFDGSTDLGVFTGIPQKDLEVGDTFEEYDMENGGYVTREITSKEYQGEMLFVRSVIVNA